MPMIRFCFIQLHSIQLHILFCRNTIYNPHIWSCWSLKASLEYLRDESNKKSKYSYAALERCKRYNMLEEIYQVCAACFIRIQRKMCFSYMLKYS